MSDLKKLAKTYREPELHWVGDGFPVRTLFSHSRRAQELSPFLMLDYAGPVHFKPSNEPRGVDEHPHRGFETVTIVYRGELDHRDSSGNSGSIGPGDVQWMTAASGVVHEEKHSDRFTKNGGILEMVQLWVNLPAKDKMSRPRYQTFLSRDIPVVDIGPWKTGKLRVIAGAFQGKKGPAKTFTPVSVFDVMFDVGGECEFSIPPEFTGAIAVLRGTLLVNEDQQLKDADVLLFAHEGERVTVKANQRTRCLVLSGEPINEPIAAYGPFVMNTEAEIRQAIADYRNGRMGTLDVRIKPSERTGT
jgi:hypothetical protein